MRFNMLYNKRVFGITDCDPVSSRLNVWIKTVPCIVSTWFPWSPRRHWQHNHSIVKTYCRVCRFHALLAPGFVVFIMDILLLGWVTGTLTFCSTSIWATSEPPRPALPPPRLPLKRPIKMSRQALPKGTENRNRMPNENQSRHTKQKIPAKFAFTLLWVSSYTMCVMSYLDVLSNWIKNPGNNRLDKLRFLTQFVWVYNVLHSDSVIVSERSHRRHVNYLCR